VLSLRHHPGQHFQKYHYQNNGIAIIYDKSFLVTSFFLARLMGTGCLIPIGRILVP
jgi:hypothetical protein